MKNASVEDVARAKETGKLEENVMYNYFGLKVHGKRVVPPLSAFLKSECGSSMNIAETDEGEIMRVDTAFLSGPKQKGPAKQPKKPRRKPIKGTKPETKIPMSDDVKLEVGDVVLVNNQGKMVRAVVAESNGSGTPYYLRCKHDIKHDVDEIWFFPSGMSNINYEVFITHKIIPYQGPVKEEKSPEQEAFEKGYWVANNGFMPDFVRDVRIEVLFSHGEVSDRLGHMWYYRGDPSSTHYIVAYRKAKQ